jgi:hypothetical protein
LIILVQTFVGVASLEASTFSPPPQYLTKFKTERPAKIPPTTSQDQNLRSAKARDAQLKG